MSTTTEQSPTTDRIEKQIEVNAKRGRVWRAISDAEEFGTWFGMKLDKPFSPGARVLGRLDNPKYSHITVEMVVEKIEPEGYFAYRWHPYPMNLEVDYAKEPMTLVEFRLEESGGGTTVTIIESGFDRLPADRRVEAFRMNEGGWAAQAKNLARHVG